MHLNERVNGYCFSQYADAGNTFCGKGAVCCCSFILIPILFIFAVIIAARLFSVNIVSGRCIFFYRISIVPKDSEARWPKMDEGDGSI